MGRIPYLIGDEQQATLALPVLHDLLPMLDAQGKTAWIIEDSPSFMEMLDGELTDLGFDTQLAPSAEAFIDTAFQDTAPSNNEPPAIIITDYQLPKASGLAVLQAVREHWPTVPVLLLSAIDNSKQPLYTDSRLSFCSHLSKPIDLLALRLELAKLCNLTKIS